jgi:hypothetical protein
MVWPNAGNDSERPAAIKIMNPGRQRPLAVFNFNLQKTSVSLDRPPAFGSVPEN